MNVHLAVKDFSRFLKKIPGFITITDAGSTFIVLILVKGYGGNPKGNIGSALLKFYDCN